MRVRVNTEIKLDVQRVTLRINRKMKEAITAASRKVERGARAMSPVLTGKNQASIKREVKEERGKIGASVFTTSGYGAFVEMGTKDKKRPARPYMRPALEKNKGDVTKALRGAI